MFQKENYTPEDEAELSKHLDEQIVGFCDIQDRMKEETRQDLGQILGKDDNEIML